MAGPGPRVSQPHSDVHVHVLHCTFQGAVYPFLPAVFLKLNGPLDGSWKYFCHIQKFTFMESVLNIISESTFNYQNDTHVSELTMSQKYPLLTGRPHQQLLSNTLSIRLRWVFCTLKSFINITMVKTKQLFRNWDTEHWVGKLSSLRTAYLLMELRLSSHTLPSRKGKEC